jgi:hypothetical protein
MIAYTALSLLRPSPGETLEIITGYKRISTARAWQRATEREGATRRGAIEGTAGKRASSERRIHCGAKRHGG